MKKVLVVFLFISVILVSGCIDNANEEVPIIGENGGENNNTTDVNQFEEEPKDVVRNYLESYSNPEENLSEYIHPNSPEYKELSLSKSGEREEDYIDNLRNRSRFTQLEIQVLSREENKKVVIKVSGITELEDGNVTLDERFEENVTLKSDGNSWKIFSAKRLD